MSSSLGLMLQLQPRHPHKSAKAIVVTFFMIAWACSRASFRRWQARYIATDHAHIHSLQQKQIPSEGYQHYALHVYTD